MPPHEMKSQELGRGCLVGLVDPEQFCGGPTMIFEGRLSLSPVGRGVVAAHGRGGADEGSARADR
ncbi:MAG: hypothetical protein ABT940_08680 [Alphaproteobacteria bacterium]